MFQGKMELRAVPPSPKLNSQISCFDSTVGADANVPVVGRVADTDDTAVTNSPEAVLFCAGKSTFMLI